MTTDDGEDADDDDNEHIAKLLYFESAGEEILSHISHSHATLIPFINIRLV